MAIPWETYTRFYAVDEWITYADFDYQGALYGWGPSPPDQFSLHFAHHHIRQQRPDQPFSLFFISQNSHNPFVSPDEVIDDWQSLNDTSQYHPTQSRIFEPPVLANYDKAIRYQLEYLIHFILQEGREEDLFIIVGDHQPPLFPKPGAGFETPLHLIGRDSALIHSFAAQQLEAGLLLDSTQHSIRHEGFYSLLLHHLSTRWGTAEANIPPYLPLGETRFFPPSKE